MIAWTSYLPELGPREVRVLYRSDFTARIVDGPREVTVSVRRIHDSMALAWCEIRRQRALALWQNRLRKQRSKRLDSAREFLAEIDAARAAQEGQG